jgi:hypothetical protein
MRMSAVRDRNLSLWQSAVGEVAAKFAKTDQELMKAVQRAAALHAAAAVKGADIGPANDQSEIAKGLKESSPETLAYVSQLVFGLARAYQTQDSDAEAQAKSRLENFVARHYASLDLLGWMQCVYRYLDYYASANRKPPYIDWAEQSPADINYGMIDYRLPCNSKVLLLGDWGTRMTDNVAMLRQALMKFNPDAIVHLGDVYYSGTQFECEQNVLQVMDDLIEELKMAKRPPFFALPGNHEYYSGGGGFFDMISRINSGLAGCLQRASYFCLRTEDDAWQFLGMDTGYNDRDPITPTAPGLQASEIRWHYDKLDNFRGSTVLLSHHQMFSAHDKLNNGSNGYLNEALSLTFKNYFDRVSAWYWGHEHNFVIFKEGQCGLRKGRLLGCSAYEETQEEDPYKVNFRDIRYAADMTELSLSKYQGGTQKYFNHAMAVLEVSPEKIAASYYEFPSWDDDFVPPTVDQPEPLYNETISPSRPQIA